MSNVTVKNYKTLAAASKYAEIQQKISHKTRTCHIAENLIMSAVSFLMTIATTHYFVGEPTKHYHKKSIKHSNEGAKLLERMVSISNKGAPIHPVIPALMTSTDNTTMFVFKGRATLPENWYLIQGGGLIKKQKY